MSSESTEQGHTVDELLSELQDEWGQVYVRYMGEDYYDGKECSIRNVTDEGLPVNCEKKEVTAETFTDALQKAHATRVTT